jgi:ABC-2 type transport system permease protein
MAKRFVAGTQESATTPLRPRGAPASIRFRTGLWRNVLVKEWKLIGRDPQLIANTLLQSLYMLPIAFAWIRDDSPQTALAPTMVLLAATLASGLVWLTVAAEDAPELLASAPVDRGLLRRAKLVAGLAPVWLIALPLILVLALADVGAAAIFAICVVGATISAGSIHLLLPRPGRRRDLRRRGKGDLLGSLLELMTAIAWPALTWCLLTAPRYAPLPAALAIATPLAAWWLGRHRRDEFTAA